MTKWRFAAGFFLVVIAILAPYHLLGFHEAAEPVEMTLLVGVAIIWCICDAVTALRNSR